MINENRQATTHLRLYDSDGLVMSTNPLMPANELAHKILDILEEGAKMEDNNESFDNKQIYRLNDISNLERLERLEKQMAV